MHSLQSCRKEVVNGIVFLELFTRYAKVSIGNVKQHAITGRHPLDQLPADAHFEGLLPLGDFSRKTSL